MKKQIKTDKKVEKNTKAEKNTWDGGYQKSELLILAEEIYKKQGEISELEFQLADEEFHFKYIPIRKKRITQRLRSHIKYHLIAIPVLLLSIVETAECILQLNMPTKDGYVDSRIGSVVLACLCLLVFGGYFYFKFFLMPDFRDFKKLRYYENVANEDQFVDAFKVEYEESKHKVDFLRAKIEKLSDEIGILLQQKEALLLQMTKGNEAAAKKEDIWNIKKQEDSMSSFSLKQEDTQTVDISELFEFYKKEESYYRYCLQDLEVKLQAINREIVDIQERFDSSKKTILYGGIVFILIVLIQQAFGGIFLKVSSVVCLIAFSLAFIWLERKCKPAIINYLIEEENDWVSEYAFKTSAIPKKYKRQEIMDEIKKMEKSIENIQERKKELD